MTDRSWLEILDNAMDDQVALLEKDPHGESNHFTRKRIIQIWKWRNSVLSADLSEPDSRSIPETRAGIGISE